MNNEQYPLVSIVIPFFNTGESIASCIRSIMKQDYPSLETILVDDGSTDRTCETVHKLTRKDERFKIVRQENKGQNAARRRGLNEAKGKYVYFSDSDDTLNEKAISSLVQIAESKNCDMVISNIRDVYPDSCSSKTSDWFTESDASSKKDIVLAFLYKIGCGSLCAKLYRREKFGFDDIWLDESIRANEDYLVYVQNVIRHFDRFAFSTYTGYNYIHRTGTMSAQKSVFLVRDTLKVSYFIHCLIQCTFPGDEQIGRALSYFAYKKLYFSLCRNIDIVHTDKKLLNILLSIAETHPSIYKTLSKKEKIYLRLIRCRPVSVKIFQRALGIYRRRPSMPSDAGDRKCRN